MCKLKINSHSHKNQNQTKKKRQKLVVLKKKEKTGLENQNKEWKKIHLKIKLYKLIDYNQRKNKPEMKIRQKP